MPAMTLQQIRAVYDDAFAFELARRSASSSLMVMADAATVREIENVALQAVARAQLMVAAPTTNDSAISKRLARQCRQLNHMQNTMAEDVPQAARIAVDAQYNTTLMMAQVGIAPSEKWETLAEYLITANVELVAHIVAEGLGSLPPAEYDHD